MNDSSRGPLKDLIEKYVKGEITEAQFRDQLENIIKTKILEVNK